MRLWKEERGLTLVELIVGMAILAVVFAGIAYAFQGMVRSQTYNYEYGANVQDGGAVMRLISDEIKNAASIVSPMRGQGSAKLLYSYKAGEGIKQAGIYVEQDAIVIEKDGKKRKLAIGRVWPSNEADTDDGSLYFQFEAGSSQKALIDVKLKIKNVQKKNQAVHPDLEYKMRISTLNNLN